MDELHQLCSMAPSLTERIDLDALTSAAASNPAFRALLDEFLREYGHLLDFDGDPSVESGKQAEIPLAREADSSEPMHESATGPSGTSSSEAAAIYSKRGICDPAFESLVEMLVRHYRNGLPPEDAGSDPENTEPQFLLPIPSSLSPAASQEGPGYESASG